MLAGLDLNKDPESLWGDVMEAYDRRLGLDTERAVDFGSANYYDEEGVFEGSLRQSLTMDYALLDIREYYGMTMKEWFSMDYIDILRHKGMVTKIVEEKNRLWKVAEENKKKEKGKRGKGSKL